MMMNVVEPLIASGVGAIVESAVAFASVDLPLLFAGDATGYRGSVGQLVAATLQSKGLYDQAKILSDLKEGLEFLAAFAYLFSLVLAIASYAVLGNYRNALYLLVGPPLFFFMITTTTSTDGVKVKIGKREVQNSVADQNNFLRYVALIGGNPDGTGGTNVNISFFFALYDSIVSELTQAVVGVLVDTENREDLRVVARERALSFVLQATGSDAGYNSLVSGVNYGECGKLVSQQMRVGALTPVGQPTAPDTQLTLDRLKLEWTASTGAPIDYKTKEFLVDRKAIIPGFETVPIDDPNLPLTVSCKQVWEWVKSASIWLAEKHLDPATFQGLYRDTSEAPWDAVYRDLREFLETNSGTAPTGGQVNAASAVLAAYIYKNVSTRNTHQALQAQVFNRSPMNAKRFEAVFDHLTRTEAAGGFFKLNFFAGTIPYMQGIMLYFLAIGFPFFAIFLVIPGRAMSFLIWCSLWAWVKSWDIGFALVHVARDISWHMMGGRVNKHSQPVSWDSEFSIFQLITHNDPLSTQNTYWELTAMLTVLVPFLTAHFFLGATGMFQAFSMGIDRSPDQIATRERARSRRFLANINEQMRRSLTEQIAGQAGMRAFHLGQGGVGEGQTARTFSGVEIGQAVSPEVSALWQKSSELAAATPGSEDHQRLTGEIAGLKQKIGTSGPHASLSRTGLSSGSRYAYAVQAYERMRTEMPMWTHSWARTMKHAELERSAIMELGALGPDEKTGTKADELTKKRDDAAAELAKEASSGTAAATRVNSARATAEMYAGLPALYSDPDEARKIQNYGQNYQHLEQTLAMYAGRTQFTQLEGSVGGSGRLAEHLAVGRMKSDQLGRTAFDGSNANYAPMLREVLDWHGGERIDRPGDHWNENSAPQTIVTGSSGDDGE